MLTRCRRISRSHVHEPDRVAKARRIFKRIPLPSAHGLSTLEVIWLQSALSDLHRRCHRSDPFLYAPVCVVGLNMVVTAGSMSHLLGAETGRPNAHTSLAAHALLSKGQGHRHMFQDQQMLPVRLEMDADGAPAVCSVRRAHTILDSTSRNITGDVTRTHLDA